MTTEVINLNLKNYNSLQRAIFKKYHLQNTIVYETTGFYILCSRISQQRECEMCYSTIKRVIKEVKDMIKNGEIHPDLKESEKVTWKPNKYDTYFFVDYQNLVAYRIYTGNNSDKVCEMHGNIFETEDEAEMLKEYYESKEYQEECKIRQQKIISKGG